MSDDPGDEDRDWAADKRDLVADARDAIGDERDDTADARDAVAGHRDVVADVREAELRAWERRLEERASRLGLVEGPMSGVVERAEAAQARAAAERERLARASEREDAGLARDEATRRRLAQRRDTLLAAAFAGVAEHLYESESADELLTRIAEAAVAVVAGSTMATVVVHDGDGDRTGASTEDAADTEVADDGQQEPVLSFDFTTPVDGTAEPAGASLNIYAADPDALDETAREIGFILVAHASLAARAVGDRVRLEGLGQRLEDALLSRDVIGQAKGILMERLKTTPDDAFEVLKRVSQRLNVKLREVARTLADTGELGEDGLLS